MTAVFVDRDYADEWMVFISSHETGRIGLRSVHIDPDCAIRWEGKICQAVKRYCFGRLGAHRIWTAVPETNRLALKLFKKQGFKVDGKCREAFFRDGKYIDQVMMSILGDEK